jgi:hypothetical protein
MRTKLVPLLVLCFAVFISQTALAQYTGGSYDGHGMGTSGSDISLPVTLSAFTARAGDGEVTLHWITESETDNLGFHVYRALSEDEGYQRVTAELIEGAGSTTGRREYAFTGSMPSPMAG